VPISRTVSIPSRPSALPRDRNVANGPFYRSAPRHSCALTGSISGSARAAAADTLELLTPDDTPLAAFTFPRQSAGERLCLADYVRDDIDDYVALFAVTCGEGVRERAETLKECGDYLKSHALQALAIECAEAFAEMLHARLRTLWGFPDPPDLSIGDKLKAHYRGLRVSFGYPACSNLADQ